MPAYAAPIALASLALIYAGFAVWMVREVWRD